MTIQFDYSESSDEKKFREMIEKVKKLDIGMLVNNVGTSEIKEYGKFSYE
jgi:short-subunit dehydrogenase